MGVYVKRIGARYSMISGLLASAAIYALLVPAVLAADTAASATAGAIVCVVLGASCNAALCTAGAACFAATNNACARYPDRIGSINGVAVTFEAIGKMAGPAVGAPLLSGLLAALRPPAPPSVDRPVSLLGNGAFATFGIIGATSLLFGALALVLPSSVDGPRTSSALLERSATRSDDPGHHDGEGTHASSKA